MLQEFTYTVLVSDSLSGLIKVNFIIIIILRNYDTKLNKTIQNTMTVSEELKNKAIKLGLCKQWTDDWGEADLDTLCELYTTGIDFCIINSYPSNEYIKTNFGKIAENHGIFTDANIDVTNPDIAILNGKTKGYIKLTGFASRDIYVRHNSIVTIEITDQARAFIRIFDNAFVKVINKTTNKIFVYKYSDKAVIKGDVQVREKSLREL